MRVIGVIPARMGSTRFPGKPLAKLGERSMIEHVYRGTSACPLLDEVVVATCDHEIVRAAQAFGARAILTSAAHERASDRVAEACANDEAEIIVMVQGDEPMVAPSMIASVVSAITSDAGIACVNLAAPIETEAEARDSNTIKVVMSRDGTALYFSRSLIPAEYAPGAFFRQVCVIGFRREALQRFSTLPQGPLERLESVDMLRFLENGIPVKMVRTELRTHPVDTPADLDLVARLMELD
jgi:3-deoxy-manno-octulosonate cytidylyltransferase (CMP-KDO synthetase)